jgi:zinc protease
MRWVTMIRAAVLLGTVSGSATQSLRAAPAPPVERAVLANGVRVLVIPQPHLPMVVLSALVDAGSRFDPAGKEGLASLVATLLTEGTEKRSATEIHEAVDFLGAKIGSAAGDDYASVSLTVLKKDLGSGMDLFADALLHPGFRQADFARKRDEALADIESEEQSPGTVADRAFRKALFQGGPYRNAPGGWKESVAGLRGEDVKRFYGATYWPDRTILVASGDVTMSEIQGFAERYLSPWQPRGAELPSVAPAPASGPKIERIDRDLTQANIVWGHIGTTRDDPDWYAMQVMNYILGGGGFSSRMMASIRTEAGLAYSVYSYFVPGKVPGSFQVVLQTKSASTADALARLEKEIARVRSEPVSDDELSAAKKYLTGSFPLRFDSNGEMVSFYSQIEYYGIGLDYPARYDGLINSVTQDDVLRVARKYLHPDQAILVVVGKQSEIKLP